MSDKCEQNLQNLIFTASVKVSMIFRLVQQRKFLLKPVQILKKDHIELDTVYFYL